jgi:cytochrome c biogenesis protein CcmG/thiol:disulfide interchange protein DsbE
MKKIRWSIPLVIFVVLVAFLWIGLGRDPREVPSPLIGKSAPAFKLTQLHETGKTLSNDDLKGKVWLLNVWASWCVSCRVEHPLLVQLAKANIVPVYGLDYKDKPDDGRAWLAQNGDPYSASIVDQDGRVGIDYGVYGVPETFVIDKSGVVRYKQIGPLTVEALQQKILPLVRELQK